MIGVRDRRALTATGISKGFERSLSDEVHNVLKATGRISRKAGCRAYLVGGIVRDIAVGYPNTDLDIMIEGDAEKVARELARRIAGRFKKPTEFGTCKVETEHLGTIDFAVARTETYGRPGALPEVSASDIARDLWRRDFTINALAISLDPESYGDLVDPCGGIADLRRGRLRVMHDASFGDDPTRILRGVRFAVRYGYMFEARTLGLLRACVARGCLKTVSGKRVARELLLICGEPKAREGLLMLQALGVLKALGLARRDARRRLALWRGITRATDVLRKAGGTTSDEAPVWFASLLAGGGADAARKAASFSLPRDLRDASAWAATKLARAERRLAGIDGRQAYRATRLLDSVPPAGLALIYAASAPPARRLIVNYLSDWRHVKPRVTGGEIAAMGPGPGPHVGRLLDRVLRLRLDGRLPTRRAEIEYVKRAVARLR